MNIEKVYKDGLKILEKLNKLSDSELKSKLNDIIGDDINNKNDLILSDNSQTDRKIRNEVINEITIYYYDGIRISPFGINYCPEHGESVKLLDFDKVSKLINIL